MDEAEQKARLAQTEAWKARIASTAAREVRRYRLARGMSVQRLADICTEEYGLPMKRSVLANFEGGRRPALSVAELLILARILQAPPLLFIFPVGQEETVEVLPGEAVDTWDALQWFTGEGRFPSERIPRGETEPNTGLPEWYDDPEEGWQEGAAPIVLTREHARLVAEWAQEQTSLRRIVLSMSSGESEAVRPFRVEADPDAADLMRFKLHEQRLRRIEEDLDLVRAQMRSLGMTPPDDEFITRWTADNLLLALTTQTALANIPSEPLQPESDEDE
ncbi:helix-turn-helix domain-containing protein [Streptomyces sp. NPDC008079]|uniref:helix-turn-helix domain-containing protein n=1 Tax=Streptomyces sp. NPDC008079 TaxID=3364806 RepID=UPI0036E937B0